MRDGRCEAELDAWRAYCEETTSLSFQEVVMQTRIALRTSLPAPQNEWWNPDSEEVEHIGLKYLKCTEAEWEQMRLDWLDRRLLLPDPDQISCPRCALRLSDLERLPLRVIRSFPLAMMPIRAWQPRNFFPASSLLAQIESVDSPNLPIVI